MNSPDTETERGLPHGCRELHPDSIPGFVENEIFSSTRTLPIMAFTSWRSGQMWTVDPALCAQHLGDKAQLVFIETGEATWSLSECLPPRLDVYGGAARVWHAGITRDADPYEHPLVFMPQNAAVASAIDKLGAALAGEQAWASMPCPPSTLPVVTTSTPRCSRQRKAVPATVTGIQGRVIQLCLPNGGGGQLRYTDEPLDRVAGALKAGDRIQVVEARPMADGTRCFSTQGLQLALPSPRSPAVDEYPVTEGVVHSIAADRIQISARGMTGTLSAAGNLIEDIGANAQPGDIVQVQRLPDPIDGCPQFRFIAFDPWQRLARLSRVGDTIRARVSRIAETYLLAECLPGADLLVPISEIAWQYTSNIGDIYQVGERCHVKLLELDPVRRRGTASIKQGMGQLVKPPLVHAPGQTAYLDDDNEPPVNAGRHAPQAATPPGLAQELDAALNDRQQLLKEVRQLREQAATLRKELKSERDRVDELGSQLADRANPTASAQSFLLAVRLKYARAMGEADRQQHTLHPMRIGNQFLSRLTQMEGIQIEKVVEVCMQVACGRAQQLAARSVHQLRDGPAGAPGVVRNHDQARAWRCSLQVNAASARRLHWWDIPGPSGRTIEFASVCLHDDMSIPE